MKKNLCFSVGLLRIISVSSFLTGFVLIGFIDAVAHGENSYSAIMSIDINRVYFYTVFLLTVGSLLLYNKWLSGIGFLTVAAFSCYFKEFDFFHNYIASVSIYVLIVTDMVIRRKYLWAVPIVICGTIQAVVFETIAWESNYPVLILEFLGLCIGTIFIVTTEIKRVKSRAVNTENDKQP